MVGHLEHLPAAAHPHGGGRRRIVQDQQDRPGQGRHVVGIDQHAAGGVDQFVIARDVARDDRHARGQAFHDGHRRGVHIADREGDRREGEPQRHLGVGHVLDDAHGLAQAQSIDQVQQLLAVGIVAGREGHEHEDRARHSLQHQRSRFQQPVDVGGALELPRAEHHPRPRGDVVSLAQRRGVEAGPEVLGIHAEAHLVYAGQRKARKAPGVVDEVLGVAGHEIRLAKGVADQVAVPRIEVGIDVDVRAPDGEDERVEAGEGRIQAVDARIVAVEQVGRDLADRALGDLDPRHESRGAGAGSGTWSVTPGRSLGRWLSRWTSQPSPGEEATEALGVRAAGIPHHEQADGRASHGHSVSYGPHDSGSRPNRPASPPRRPRGPRPRAGRFADSRRPWPNRP